MKSFFKNKKIWAFTGVFSFGIAAFAGFSYYKGWFGADFAERTPQSKTRVVYQAAQDIITKLRRGKLTDLKGENLQGAHLRGLKHDTPGRWLDFDSADLRRADLSNSQFRMVRVINTNLEKAKLQNAVWDLALVRGANFKGAKMQGIKIDNYVNVHEKEVGLVEGIVNVSFKGAKMQRAKIAGKVDHTTDFRGARLQGADLSGVSNLNIAKLKGAVYDDSTQFPDYFTQEMAERLGMIKR